jgi:hypothetical protein
MGRAAGGKEKAKIEAKTEAKEKRGSKPNLNPQTTRPIPRRSPLRYFRNAPIGEYTLLFQSP